MQPKSLNYARRSLKDSQNPTNVRILIFRMRKTCEKTSDDRRETWIESWKCDLNSTFTYSQPPFPGTISPSRPKNRKLFFDVLIPGPGALAKTSCRCKPARQPAAKAKIWWMTLLWNWICLCFVIQFAPLPSTTASTSTMHNGGKYLHKKMFM